MSIPTYTHLTTLQTPITPTLEHIYAALNLTSIVLLLILGTTIIISKRLKRDPTLLNTFAVIIFVDFVNVLYYLVRRGEPLEPDIDGSLPSRGVCRAQASLGAGSQAAQASAVFTVCLQLWISLMQLENDWFHRLRSRYIMGLLLALPWLCIAAFIPPMAIATGQMPELLTPSPFYCSLNDSVLRSAYSKLALVFSALSLLLELHLIYLVLRRFRQTSTITPQTTSLISIHLALPERRSIPPTFIVRVAIFMLWTIAMMLATLYQAFDDSTESPFSDLVFACVGLLAFLCFATQPDVLRVWGIRKVARLWSNKRVEGRRQELVRDDQGWSDFLGRDDSDTTLSSRVDPGSGGATADQQIMRALRSEELDVEDKSPTPTPTPKPSERDGDGVDMDLLSALDRGPSR